MNIRLSEDSIRFRLSLPAALDLEKSGTHEVSMLTPGGRVRLVVRCVEGDEARLSQDEEPSWILQLPRSRLLVLLAAARESSSPRRSLEWSFDWGVQGQIAQVRVEIDQFSVKLSREGSGPGQNSAR